MSTTHLKYAVEIEKTGSISQAAENLFMAQPNLSKAIRELEDSLGIIIFERTSKGVKPTLQGNEFLKYAKNILCQIDKMQSIHISKEERENRQSLRLSIPRGSYISTAFVSFVNSLDSSKNIDLNIHETNSVKTITDVSENKFDLGIIRYQKQNEKYFKDYLKGKNLVCEPLWEFSCLVLMSKEHDLASGEDIKYEDLLSNYIEIVHGDNLVPYLQSPANDQLDIEKSKKKIYVYERGSQLELLSTVKNTFMLVSPVPKHLLERYNLVQRACDIPNNKFVDLLVYQSDYDFTKFDKLFLNKLYEVKNEVSHERYY